MRHNSVYFVLCLLGLVLIRPYAAACDLCARTTPPLSHAINDTKLVVFGHVTSAKLAPDNFGGTSELKIDAIIKAEPRFQDLKTITLAKYVPPDPKIKGWLMFIDTPRGRLDPLNGIAFASDRVLGYLKESPTLTEATTRADRKPDRLLYYFKFLNDSEPEISIDAYKEWATASNSEVGAVAGKLSAKELRTWLLDPQTPADRLGLYAFLLGASGTDHDAEILRRLVLTPDDRVSSAMDGLLAGLIQLKPDEGWKLTAEVIKDSKRPFTQRYGILRLLKFYYGYQPEKYRAQVLRCVTLMLNSDIHDIAVDQLRKWQLWDLTDQVLALWGKEEASAPITKRTIVRYGLICPDPKAKRFIEMVRLQDPELVKTVEATLQSELSKLEK